MSRLLAQCGQNITATFDEPKSVITVHREGRGSCLTNNAVRLFASYDSGGWVEINDCYLPAGSVCQQDTPGSVACAAEGEHRADVFVICNVPGPNNGCVEASGGMPVFYNLSHSVSVSAGVFGAPYYDNHNNKLMNFKVHAEWQGAASSQLLWSTTSPRPIRTSGSPASLMRRVRSAYEAEQISSAMFVRAKLPIQAL